MGVSQHVGRYDLNLKGHSAAIEPMGVQKKGVVCFVSFKPVPCFLKHQTVIGLAGKGKMFLLA